jgi:hypothetical protein
LIQKGRRMRSSVLLALVVVVWSGCSRDRRSPATPSSPVGPAGVPSAAGVNGTVYWKSLAGRTPAQGVYVDLWIQVQTGPASGYSSWIDGGTTNDRGAFHIDSAPIGARVLASARNSGAWNPCMAFVGNYQGSADVEIDLYQKTESPDWIVDATLAGRGPLVTGSATASGVPQSDGFVYFEALYESYSAFSPIDGSGRYAFCGLPVNLMFPSRLWIENGARSCDGTGEAYAFHSIHPSALSDFFRRDFDLHQCRW